MNLLPPSLERAITLLSRLPGVGERSATRLAFFILQQQDDYAATLGRAIADMSAHIQRCERCHMVCEDTVCAICEDPTRDSSLICVVERIQDLMAFERSGSYRGSYYVLGGALSPLKGLGPEHLQIPRLLARVMSESIDEVIVATDPDVEGEATALYIARRLRERDVTVSRIATGIPMGGDLEYVDHSTLGRALAGRVVLDS